MEKNDFLDQMSSKDQIIKILEKFEDKQIDLSFVN